MGQLRDSTGRAAADTWWSARRITWRTSMWGWASYDTAVDMLEQAFEERSGAISGIKGSFLFAPLRTHPRFTALLKKMHLQ